MENLTGRKKPCQVTKTKCFVPCTLWFGNYYSNWITVNANEERKLDLIKITDTTIPSILLADVSGGSRTIGLSYLNVALFDQYGADWPDRSGFQWICDDNAVAISGETLTVSDPGSYQLYVQLGGVTSNKLTLTAYDGTQEVTSISANRTSMSSAGGVNTITLNGSYLPNNILVAAFDASGAIVGSAYTSGSLTSQRASLNFPANTSTTDNVAYTVKYSFDGGISYQASPSATVSVAAVISGGGGGGGGGGGSSTTVVPDTDVPLASVISFSGFINGYSDGSFHGEDIITREQFVAILYRLNAKDTAPADKTKPSLRDVAPDRWSYDAIEWALSEEIIESDENGNFRPGDPLTRSEMAVMLVKCLNLEEGAENIFTDLSGHKDVDYILKAVKAGIFNGYPDGRFGPDDSTTRDQAVAALIRYLLGGEPTDEMLAGLEMPLADVPETHWAYDYILLAVHGYTEAPASTY